MKRMKGFMCTCETLGEEKDYYFLRVRYSKEYTGQIQIREPEKEIPKMIKILEKTLKKCNQLSKLNKNKKSFDKK